MTPPDCGDNSCRYAPSKGGMRTNAGCICDDCPECGKTILPIIRSNQHRPWCPCPSWVPPHHRKENP